MQYGIIHLAIVPLRDAPMHKAQQVSQLLFGEGFEVLETQGDWLQIQTENDEYLGWIQAIQSVFLNAETYQQNQEKPFQLTTEPVTIVRKIADGSLLYLPAGSRIAGVEQNQFSIGNTTFELLHQFLPGKNSIINYAYSYLNTPYLWGGRTHFGIDCSGFAQVVYRQQGIQLKRDAWQQAEQGKAVDFLQSTLPGDLAFFDNEEGRIVHVGMMLNNEQIIHASGNVKIDRIDNQGIYSAEQKKYTHHLRIIKRFF
ncbi:MAG: NlpC/P60 family protein [Mucilaginibacter sp.]|uniref:C40 family peptidase n=1 Tax=Mucilaginibacter sp. TaxID=1882438 RepID=UPI0034E42384